MTPCTVTTGFFLLGRCGSPSASWCPQCRRPLCGAHQGPGGLCPECAAARGWGAQDPHDPRWAQTYRRRYRSSSAQTYADTTWYSTFDSYDRSAFDPGNQASGESEGGGSFDEDAGMVDS